MVECWGTGREVWTGRARGAAGLKCRSGFVYATIMTYTEQHKTDTASLNYVGPATPPHHELIGVTGVTSTGLTKNN